MQKITCAIDEQQASSSQHNHITPLTSLARQSHNKPSIMDAPYVDFFARQDGPDAAPMGSATKNLSGFTGHFGFFMFNTINFLYLVLFEWYAFRRLPQNNLLRLTFCAVVMQLVSCYSSITRFNVCVESFFLYGGFSTYILSIANYQLT